MICRCGNVNCLEALAGGAALARDGEEPRATAAARSCARMLDEKGALDARDVALGAAHGDATSVELLANAGTLVGQAVAAMVNFFNPSLVVIGGGVAEAGDGLLATIRQAVYRRSLPLATRNLGIHRSTLGWKAGVVGAATMVANELFARDFLPLWLDAGVPAGGVRLERRAGGCCAARRHVDPAPRARALGDGLADDAPLVAVAKVGKSGSSGIRPPRPRGRRRGRAA